MRKMIHNQDPVVPFADHDSDDSSTLSSDNSDNSDNDDEEPDLTMGRNEAENTPPSPCPRGD